MPRTFDDANTEYLSATIGHFDEPITIAGWFNFDDTPDDEQSVICLNDISGVDGHFLKVDTSVAQGDRVEAHTRGATLVAAVVGTPTVSTWHHATGRFAGDASRFAGLDGTEGVEQTTSETVADIDTVTIGALRSAGGDLDLFSGSLFWLALWKPESGTGLSADSQSRLANGVEPVFVERHALKFFSRCMADEDQDVIGGLALAANGTPTVSNDFPTTMIRALPRGRGRDRHRFT